jgi:5'-nucleotidase / UDP-sugar diphosphatase
VKALILLVALFSIAAIGCNKNKKPAGPVPSDNSVLDLSPISESTPAYDPTPSARPQVTITPPAGSETYLVQKGDTLFSIAARRYGNGNQWKRITAANPGLTPENLKAGQRLILP